MDLVKPIFTNYFPQRWFMKLRNISMSLVVTKHHIFVLYIGSINTVISIHKSYIIYTLKFNQSFII